MPGSVTTERRASRMPGFDAAGIAPSLAHRINFAGLLHVPGTQQQRRLRSRRREGVADSWYSESHAPGIREGNPNAIKAATCSTSSSKTLSCCCSWLPQWAIRWAASASAAAGSGSRRSCSPARPSALSTPTSSCRKSSTCTGSPCSSIRSGWQTAPPLSRLSGARDCGTTCWCPAACCWAQG